MQTTNAYFDDLASANMRPLSWAFKASFDKSLDPSLEFFTLDVSLLDGDDVLAPSSDNVPQEWDKYNYLDYSDRVVQMEWSREEEVPFSVNLAMADLVLNNYDNYFTRGSSPLDPYLLPRRPIRLLSGFGDYILPQFVGLTEGVPVVDRTGATASVHATDFLSFLFNKPLDQTVMLVDVRTDEIIDYLFQLFGLLPTQYVLDEGISTVAFVYWEKGKKLGEAMREIMQAEMGSLYMDEAGVIRFRNRLRLSGNSVMTFTSKNIIDYTTSDESKIINSVEIKSKVREVQPLQVIYNLSGYLVVPAGSTLSTFFSFEDPVTTIDTITSYTANSASDESGDDVTADISVTNTDLFATSVKVTFANAGSEDAYLFAVNILGTPARVVRNVYLRTQDDVSVDEFEEQPITIENDLIQDIDGANSIAFSLLNFYGKYASTIELTVKGNPALQLGDSIDLQVDDINDTFVISKITNILDLNNGYTQRLVVKLFDVPPFFILSSDTVAMSLLDGEDVLAP